MGAGGWFFPAWVGDLGLNLNISAPTYTILRIVCSVGLLGAVDLGDGGFPRQGTVVYSPKEG